MADDNLADLSPDRHYRINGFSRVLKHYRDLATADAVDLALAEFQQVCAFEDYRTTGVNAWRYRYEPKYGVGGDGFATAALSHQSQCFPASYLKAYAVDRFQEASSGFEVHSKVTDLEQRPRLTRRLAARNCFGLVGAVQCGQVHIGQVPGLGATSWGPESHWPDICAADPGLEHG